TYSVHTMLYIVLFYLIFIFYLSQYFLFHSFFLFFFFHDPATTEIYTLSLHDALPISPLPKPGGRKGPATTHSPVWRVRSCGALRSEEHTSELQSRFDLVCRLLLEKKKKKKKTKKE